MSVSSASQIQDSFLTGSSSLSKTDCNAITSAGTLDLQDSKIHKLIASGEVSLLRCVNTGQVIASGRLFAKDCSELGDVKSSGESHFSNCAEVAGITASGSLTIENTHVKGNVVSVGAANIHQSKIVGSFECATQKVCIADSTIDKLILKPVNNSRVFDVFGLFRSLREISREQTIELTGKKCYVRSIALDDACIGKVVLRNGAKLDGWPNAHEVPFAALRK